MERKNIFKTITLVIFISLIIYLVIAQNSAQNSPAQTPFEESKLKEYLSDEKLPEFLEADADEKQEIWITGDFATKSVILKKIANDVLNERFKGGSLVENGKKVLGGVYDVIVERLKQKGLSEIHPTIKGIKFGVDIKNSQELAGLLKELGIETGDIIGGNIEEFLGFSSPYLKWSDKGKNIIGDGKVFLDLERIPLGTKKVEYSQGKFILHRYDGSKIIISNTDESGNVVLKNTGIKNENNEMEYIKINPFDIMITGDKGEVELTEGGFVLRGDVKIRWRGLTFNRLDGEKDGYVKIFKNGFILNNVIMDIKDVLNVKPTKPGDFVFFVGDTRNFLGILPKALSLDEIGKKIFESFMKNNYDIGELIQTISGMDSSSPNFAALLGENLLVGGSGEISLKKDMNSLIGIDADKFFVRVGDITSYEKGSESGGALLLLDGKNLLSSTNMGWTSKAAHTIDDITLVSGGKAGKSYQLVFDKDEKVFRVKESERLVAGRVVFKGPFGVSSDVYVTLDREDYENLRRTLDLPSLGASDKKTLIDHLMRDRFSLNQDIYIPRVEGVSVDVGDTLTETIERRLFPSLDEPIISGVRASEEAIQTIKSIIRDSVKNIKDVKPGKISVEIRNNPIISPKQNRLRTPGNPTLHISIPGQKLVTVEFTGEEGELVMDALKASLRMPDWTREPSIGFIRRPYWPAPYLKSLWYQNLGKEIERWGVGDYFDIGRLWWRYAK